MRQLVETMKDNFLHLSALHSITDGDIAYELELIENLTSDCDELVKAMKISFENQDAEAFSQQIHKFKGGILYLTGEPMSTFLNEMDRNVRRELTLPSYKDFKELQNNFKIIKDLLEDYKARL